MIRKLFFLGVLGAFLAASAHAEGISTLLPEAAPTASLGTTLSPPSPFATTAEPASTTIVMTLPPAGLMGSTSTPFTRHSDQTSASSDAERLVNPLAHLASAASIGSALAPASGPELSHVSGLTGLQSAGSGLASELHAGFAAGSDTIIRSAASLPTMTIATPQIYMGTR